MYRKLNKIKYQKKGVDPDHHPDNAAQKKKKKCNTVLKIKKIHYKLVCQKNKFSNFFDICFVYLFINLLVSMKITLENFPQTHKKKESNHFLKKIHQTNNNNNFNVELAANEVFIDVEILEGEGEFYAGRWFTLNRPNEPQTLALFSLLLGAKEIKKRVIIITLKIHATKQQ